MPIDRRYNLITLHPGKTGGTTLAYIFKWLDLPTNEKHKYLVGWAPDKKVFLGTLPIQYISKYLGVNEHINDFTKLIIVRNPYYRMLSNYLKHHCKLTAQSKSNLLNYKISQKLLLDYNKFLHSCKKILDSTPLNKLIEPQSKAQNHLIPQSEYIKNVNIKDINVIKLKNLNKELPKFFEEKLNFIYKKIPRKNQTGLKDEHYLLFYKNNFKNPKILEIMNDNIRLVQSMYKEDFITFDYSYILPEPH